jgi:hypothetical protein
MVQPFIAFEKKYINRLVEQKKFYLVTQTYKRGIDLLTGDEKIPVLLSDYDNPGLAEIHFKAVRQDKFASIIHLNKREHFDKLITMVEPTSKYNLYWSVIQDRKQLEQHLNKM